MAASRTIATFVFVAASALGPSAQAAAPCKSVLWSTAQARQVSDVVVDVQIADPAVHQVVMAKTGSPAFVRQSWRLRVQAVVWRRSGGRDRHAQAAIAALAPNSLLEVDEVDWRGALSHHRQCQAPRPDACPARCAPTLQTSLSREPVAGAQVRAWLRWTRDGWALVAERAFDARPVAGAR